MTTDGATYLRHGVHGSPPPRGRPAQDV